MPLIIQSAKCLLRVFTSNENKKEIITTKGHIKRLEAQRRRFYHSRIKKLKSEVKKFSGAIGHRNVLQKIL